MSANKPTEKKGVRGMDNEQIKRVVESLVKFVERVSEGKTTSGTEVAILPEVVSELSKITALP